MGNLLAELEQPVGFASSEPHARPHIVSLVQAAGFSASQWDPALPLRGGVRPEVELSAADERRLLAEIV
jgi:hypothetical protein